MGTTAISGPQVVYGTSATETNPPAASAFAWGEAFYDNRKSYEGSSAAIPKGFAFPQECATASIDAYLYAAGTICPAQPATMNIGLNFVSSPSPGITPNQTVFFFIDGIVPFTEPDFLILDDFHIGMIQNNLSVVTFLKKGDLGYWDPLTLLSRRISISGGSVNNTFNIRGLDIYGNFVTEIISLTGGGEAISSKAYKGLLSIIPSVSDATNITVSNTPLSGFPIIGLPLRADYVGEAYTIENGVFNAAAANFESSLYTVTGITPSSPSVGQATITIAASPFGGALYTLPVGSNITISRCNPSSYNGTYVVLTSGPGTMTVATTNTDTYVSGGSIFCDQSGNNTADVRGSFQVTQTSPYNILAYQSIPLSNMTSSIGQFGVVQFEL